MRKLKLTALIVALTAVLVGCGGGNAPSAQAPDDALAQAEGTGLADDAIKVEQLAFEVGSGVEDGNRRVLFSYTNNSDYTIIDLRLDLVVPEGAEDEELESAFADFVERGYFTADELHDIKMGCESSFAVEPGQTSGERAALIGILYVTDVAQYELMEPDMLTIQFLHDGKIYEEYYDYRTGSYTLSSDSIETDQWGDGELSEVIPRPEGALVIDADESDTQFSFEVCAMTAEDYVTYVDAVRSAGYTVDVAQTDTSYYADNEDGTYHVDLIYWDENGSLSAYVSPVEAE